MAATYSRWSRVGAFVAFALCARSLAAQDVAPVPEPDTGTNGIHGVDQKEQPLEPLPIIVSGTTADERTVIAGSRIARESLFANDGVASNTSMHGLTPGSGMTPYSNRTITKIMRSCKASDESISPETACLLLSARRAMEEQDWLTTRGLLVPLARDHDAEPGDRRAASEFLLRASELSGNAAARREALLLLVGTGTFEPAQSAAIHRNLADLALRDRDAEGAREHYRSALVFAPADAQTLANLAILEREAGIASAPQTMQRAISALQASGGDVPESWRQFVNQL